MIAPGTALREGIESILHARTGGLIVIGEPEDLSFLNSGGIKLDIDYTPAFLYQLAKMDGATQVRAHEGVERVALDHDDHRQPAHPIEKGESFHLGAQPVLTQCNLPQIVAATA